MKERLRTIQKQFVTSIILLATLSVVGLAGILYTTNAIRLHRDVSAGQLHSLTQDYPELNAYIESQKAAEPHFTKIANLVKADQQQLIGRALLYTGIPMLALSSLIGYVLARRLLKPVEETYASQERFLQDASHEMRNPLAAVTAVIQEARTNPDPNAQSKALTILDNQIGHLVKLNEDLLLLERTKHADKSLTNANASELLYDVIESVTAQANNRRIKIKSSIQPQLHVPLADREYVCVIRNIIENAIKYSPDRATIHIQLHADKNRIKLEIKDTGIGIPKDQLEHIGERFYRADNVGRKPGTGLGLAIVFQIVSRVKGSVDIQSKSQKGTTVRVDLPQITPKTKNKI